MKALMSHPDTKHLDMETMTRIACTMVVRFGEAEGESLESDLTVAFSEEEILAMEKGFTYADPEVVLQQANTQHVDRGGSPVSFGVQPQDIVSAEDVCSLQAIKHEKQRIG